MFFSTQRKTLKESGILKGMTDYHSHVLPGVDDGFQEMEQSIEALKAFEELGVRDLWLTPHIMEEYANETEELKQRCAALSVAYAEKAGNHPVKLHLAAEYMLDSLFMQRLNSDDLLPIIDGRHLLVETSYYNPPIGFEDILGKIVEHGYTPILAHPERYYYMSSQDYKQLYSKGIILQLDIFSLVDAYGKDVAGKSLSLLKKGMYSLAGSDLHELDQLMEFADVPVKKGVLSLLRNITTKHL